MTKMNLKRRLLNINHQLARVAPQVLNSSSGLTLREMIKILMKTISTQTIISSFTMRMEWRMTMN
jgi:hypothetical protein